MATYALKQYTQEIRGGTSLNLIRLTVPNGSVEVPCMEAN